MRSTDTPEFILSLFADAGIANRSPTPAEAIEIFKRFSKEPVECDDDYLLIQVGDSDVMGDSYFDLCRGFYIADSMGGGSWEQTHMEFSTSLPRKLGYEQTDICSSDFSSAEEFFSHAEAMPEYQAAQQFQPWKFEIYQCEV
jgi:hypothetical protein